MHVCVRSCTHLLNNCRFMRLEWSGQFAVCLRGSPNNHLHGSRQCDCRRSGLYYDASGIHCQNTMFMGMPWGQAPIGVQSGARQDGWEAVTWGNGTQMPTNDPAEAQAKHRRMARLQRLAIAESSVKGQSGMSCLIAL